MPKAGKNIGAKQPYQWKTTQVHHTFKWDKFVGDIIVLATCFYAQGNLEYISPATLGTAKAKDWYYRAS